MSIRAAKFIFDNSLPLIFGAVAAMLWANLDYPSYQAMLNAELFHDTLVGSLHGGTRSISLHFVINDMLMAIFFAMAAHEVWTSLLPGGELSYFRRAALPIFCAFGGMAGPATVYLLGVVMLGRTGDLAHGWAIPTATDIAFSYLVARFIFGRGHAAITFLLLLAIVDDAIGMVILAVFYPTQPVDPVWLLLCLGAVAIGVGLWMLRIRHYFWYLVLPGAISWMGFALSGLHPALGLLPIIPVLPHVHVQRIHVGWDFVRPGDIHMFPYQMRRPVEMVLGLFGLFNAGVPLGNIGGGQIEVTLLVLSGLLLGKPLGIGISAFIGVHWLGLQMGRMLNPPMLLVVGMVAGVGFTVALFVSTVAFPPGPLQDAAKLGALCSFLAAGMAWALSWIVNRRKLWQMVEIKDKP